MRRSGPTRLETLPRRKADFIEPMDCAPVPKLIDGPEWVYEILCGASHKISVGQMQIGSGIRSSLGCGRTKTLAACSKSSAKHSRFVFDTASLSGGKNACH